MSFPASSGDTRSRGVPFLRGPRDGVGSGLGPPARPGVGCLPRAGLAGDAADAPDTDNLTALLQEVARRKQALDKEEKRVEETSARVARELEAAREEEVTARKGEVTEEDKLGEKRRANKLKQDEIASMEKRQVLRTTVCSPNLMAVHVMDNIPTNTGITRGTLSVAILVVQ